jgi:hypothetical protein
MLRALSLVLVLALVACSGGAEVILPSASPAPVAVARAGENVLCDRVIDDFSQSVGADFPAGWRTRDEGDAPFARARRLWQIEIVDGRPALHATYRERAVTIALELPDWDLEAYPILEWEWKAVTLPTGGDETRGDKNDSVASVYVVWNIGFPFMVDGIRYAWSSTLPVGTRASKRMGHDKIVIVESGAEAVGRWQRVRVDVRRDHAALFGRKSRNPSALALLTDADATRSQAEAYFRNFRLCRVQTAE